MEFGIAKSISSIFLIILKIFTLFSESILLCDPFFYNSPSD